MTPRPGLTGSLHVTQGAHPPSSSTRTPPPGCASSLTAAAWNHRTRTWHRRGGKHWPHWLRTPAEPERVDALIRLAGALFLLLPGMALVAATFRQALGTAAAIVLFVTLHAGLHMLAVWREAAWRPIPSMLRALHAHAAGMMLAVTLPGIVLGATGPRPLSTSAWLLAGAICQLCSLRRVSQRLRHVLLALGSVLQFIAVALLALGTVHG